MELAHTEHMHRKCNMLFINHAVYVDRTEWEDCEEYEAYVSTILRRQGTVYIAIITTDDMCTLLNYMGHTIVIVVFSL